MHIQFFELYQPEFHKLVVKYYGASELDEKSIHIDGNLDTEPTVKTLSSPSANLTKLPNHSEHNPPSQTKPATLDGLSDLLWSQVPVPFDTTTSIDAEQRFVAIAKSLRPVLLNHTLLNKALGFVAKLPR